MITKYKTTKKNYVIYVRPFKRPISEISTINYISKFENIEEIYWTYGFRTQTAQSFSKIEALRVATLLNAIFFDHIYEIKEV